MDKFFELFGNRIEDIFIRSIMPSSILFTLLIIYDYFFNDHHTIIFLFSTLAFSDKDTSVNSSLVFISMLVFLLGYGYMVSLIQQFLDNFLKKNYDVNEFFDRIIKVNTRLEKLRNLVRVKLTIDLKDTVLDINNMTDYDLYQVLGNTSIFENNGVGKSYVDQTKVIFSFFIAEIIVLLIYTVMLYGDELFLGYTIWLIKTIVLIIIAIYMAKSRYRARNIRLYLNYIIHHNINKKQ